MARKSPFLLVGTLLILVSGPGPLAAQTKEDSTIRMATMVMNEIMATPASRIPESMLANAQGIAVIPNVIKVGLIGGVRHGKGVAVVRDDAGNWQSPSFVSLTGGSVGWQIGVQSTDVILVFKTKKSADGLMRGKFTIGADAAAAAGPVGRQAAAATDAQLKAEILSYSRSRGLFAGVSLDGSALQIDNQANTSFYYPYGAGQGVVPESAVTLVNTIAQHTATAPAAAPAVPGAAPAVPGATPFSAVGPAPNLAAWPAAAAANPSPTDQLRYQLADSALKLNALLEENWKQFLALPPGIITGIEPAAPAAVEAALANYDQVVRNPEYQKLAVRPEFQATHELLRKYAASLRQAPAGACNCRRRRPNPPACLKDKWRRRFPELSVLIRVILWRLMLSYAVTSAGFPHLVGGPSGPSLPDGPEGPS